MRPQAGQVINNKYRLVRLIGDGGMGSVYEAQHEMLGTTVALKFLHPELSRRRGLVDRFLQEARVSAKIKSPHVVQVTDVDQTPANAGGQAFIVMELVHGKTLQTLYEDLYKAGQRLGYADALEYAMQMLDGVEAAHKEGVVHRDLKPDNVMITSGHKGQPLLKLLDFGIAKLKVNGEMARGLTRPGVIMGTPEYMAPEQAYSADAVDATADVFSLAVIIFEMLAGRRPVGGDDPHEIAQAYMTGRIARLSDLMPGAAPELVEVIHRAMNPLPKNRWPSATAFREALEPFAIAVNAPSVTASHPSLPGITPHPSPVSTPAPPRSIPQTAEAPVYVPPAAQAVGPSINVSLPDSWQSQPVHGGSPPPTRTPVQGGTTPMPAHVVVSPPIAPTASAPPLDPKGATEYEAFRPPMPSSGTAPGDPGFMPAGPMGGPVSGPRHSYPGSITPYGYGTPMDPPGFEAGMRASALPPRPPAKPKKGSSLAAILLLAMGISGAVVGGLYLAHQRAKADDHNTPAPAAPPPASVQADPPVASTPPSATQVPIQQKPPQSYPQRPPQPKPSGSTPQQPPPAQSSSNNVPIIPSGLPIPLPWFNNPQQRPDPPSQPPQQQPPQQQQPPASPAPSPSPRPIRPRPNRYEDPPQQTRPPSTVPRRPTRRLIF